MTLFCIEQALRNWRNKLTIHRLPVWKRINTDDCVLLDFLFLESPPLHNFLRFHSCEICLLSRQMEITLAKTNRQLICWLLSYGCDDPNQCRRSNCSHSLQDWRATFSILSVGHMVARHRFIIRLLLDLRPSHVRVLFILLTDTRVLIVNPYIRIVLQAHSLETMTSMWLLPVVTLIVASSTGGVLAKAMYEYSTPHSLQTITISIFMVTVGFSLAFMILTIYIQKLITHGLPKGTTLLSVFLPLGPTGQAGYAIMLIGDGLKTLLPLPSSSQQPGFLNWESTGTVIDTACICLAFILWSLATMWILYAFLALNTGLRESRISFKISFWGLVFPNVRM